MIKIYPKRKHQQGNSYVRYEKFRLEQVLSRIGSAKRFRCQNMGARLGSLRLRTFAKSTVCVGCGLEASFFAVEHFKRQTDCAPHLNLYGVDEEGREILFTKDHIIPTSLGGPDHITNMQTMCCICNATKGNKFDEPVG